MKPVWQTVITIDEPNGTCMVESAKGNKYPVELNRLCNVEVGDDALVTKDLSGSWIMVDISKKYPAPLDVTEFPRDRNNCLNIIEHGKYLKVIEDMPESKRVEFDNRLLRKFINDYGMRNTLRHRYAQLGYETSTDDVEPTRQVTLEGY